MLILGIDPSLTATGAALLDIDTDPHDRSRIFEVITIRSKPQGTTVPDTVTRLGSIAARLRSWHEELRFDHMAVIAAHEEDGRALDVHEVPVREPVDLAVIEAPAFSRNEGMSHERAGLWWLIAGQLVSAAIPVLVVKPNLRAKYATGNGRAGKDEVMLAVSKRYPSADIANNNEADAVTLAAMGARLAGHPIEDRLAAKHLAAMNTLVMP